MKFSIVFLLLPGICLGQLTRECRAVSAGGGSQSVSSQTLHSTVGGVGGSTLEAEGKTLRTGFFACVTLYPDLDTDEDGTPDEIDRDNDDDGLSDQQELEGTEFPVVSVTDPNDVDSDGDGQTDGDELIHATNPLDANSLFEITALEVDAVNGTLTIRWMGVNGKTYQVNLLNGTDRSPSDPEIGAGVLASGGTAPWFEVEEEITLTLPAGNRKYYVELK